MSGEITPPKQRHAPWKPGQSGNPAGRPKGARNKFSEAFVQALADDFEEHGAAAIEAARTEDPVGYLKVCASLVPKDLNIKADATDAFIRIWEMANAKVIEHEPGTDKGRLARLPDKSAPVRN